MHSKVAKLRLFLVWALYCYSSYLYSNNKQLNLTEAFLFHQLQPAASSPFYSSYYENSSTSTTNNNYNYLNKREQHNNNRQNNDQQSTFSFSTRDLVASNSNLEQETDDKTLIGCPSECHCNKVAKIADCSNRKLLKVPLGFPEDIKRIRLERNNITELGAYAFKGLKRLQRIDLSNNNLLKIDPLAFAGGLQSLNSLILYSNKLNQLPVNLFSELSQLQLLLLNANSLQCINKELFQSLTNLNLLSLYDNNIETLANGTFDGLKNIKTIHLGKNPLICDCNLRWLADYLELNPIETSEARCEGPTRNQAKKLSQVAKGKFRCEGNEQSKTDQIASQCADQSCPSGCVCKGATVDCSRASLSESRTSGGIYELPDIPDDVPVYVTRMRINDQRIKRIRQTGLFRRLASSQKLDLGNNKIIDIEDNAINGLVSSLSPMSQGNNVGLATKPERVVFVLLENEHCSSGGGGSSSAGASGDDAGPLPAPSLDACAAAPRVNPPNFDSPCYNGGSCLASATGGAGRMADYNYTCVCPPGFVGPLCEVNVDDCAEHQCQNGALCVDGINSYRCVCRDPTTSGEFCEQLSSTNPATSNSIAPLALPIIAPNYEQAQQSAQTQLIQPQPQQQQQQQQKQQTAQQQILARSADFFRAEQETKSPSSDKVCKRVTQRRYYDDGNGCQSVRVLKISKCVGFCGSVQGATGSQQQENCGCRPAKVKRRRVRMQCSDGASYVKTIDLIKKCACSDECQQQQDSNNQQAQFANQFNATQEDQILQITTLDAVD